MRFLVLDLDARDRSVVEAFRAAGHTAELVDAPRDAADAVLVVVASDAAALQGLALQRALVVAPRDVQEALGAQLPGVRWLSERGADAIVRGALSLGAPASSSGLRVPPMTPLPPSLRERRSATGAMSLVRDGDWLVRRVTGALEDDALGAALDDFAGELRRMSRRRDRAVVLVDMLRATPPSPAARQRQELFYAEHAGLLREHAVAVAYVVRPVVTAAVAAGVSRFGARRWRVTHTHDDALAWLEEQARLHALRSVPLGLRAYLLAWAADQDARSSGAP